MARKDRFWFYDLVMLEVLYRKNGVGSQIFSGMFRKLPSTLILRFLHEQTSLGEDLRVIGACPKGMFLGGLWRTFLKSLS
jgi:lycopene beta-cyclase